MKNILEKMKAVASLTHVWVMIDHKPPTQLQRSPKLKISHWIFAHVWVMIDHKPPTQLQRSPKLKISHWIFAQCL